MRFGRKSLESVLSQWVFVFFLNPPLSRGGDGRVSFVSLLLWNLFRLLD